MYEIFEWLGCWMVGLVGLLARGVYDVLPVCGAWMGWMKSINYCLELV